MDELKKCGKDGCNPVLQRRGSMKPEDHHEQYRRLGAVEAFVADMDVHGVGLLPVKRFREDVYNVEKLGGDHPTDVRVSCSTCGKHIGWDRASIEVMRNVAPGHNVREIAPDGLDGNIPNVVARWNDAVSA